MPPLSVEEIRRAVDQVARVLMAAIDEPIPPFDSRYKGVLESCLETPFQSFGGKDVYSGIPLKSAVLFYLMTKNHPFENGNKRIAVVTLLYYLAKNNLAIKIPPMTLYEIAVLIAKSQPRQKDHVVRIVADQIEKYLLDFDDWIDETLGEHKPKK